MLRIEMEYMEAVKTIAREMRRASSEQPTKEPDWEQRRYEVARELLPALVQAKQNATGITNLTDVSDIIDAAVGGANLLILKLRKSPIPE